MDTELAMQAFLSAHRLSDDYLAHAQQWFFPLAQDLVEQQQSLARPMVVGINGSQGSGKSTLAALLKRLFEYEYALAAVDLSIDDFYLTHAQRLHLASTVHPLLATRGVPGTHDVELMRSTLQGLGSLRGQLAIPRFDKSRDDRQHEDAWPQIAAPVDIIIVEGWCLGVRAQEAAALTEPVNALERQEDQQGSWRHYVNRQLESAYPPLYDSIDTWVMLKAPSFDTVFQWRSEQEKKLAAVSDGAGVMDDRQLVRFIQHYQRLTEHALDTLPTEVDYLFTLNEQREVQSSTRPKAVVPA